MSKTVLSGSLALAVFALLATGLVISWARKENRRGPFPDSLAAQSVASEQVATPAVRDEDLSDYDLLEFVKKYQSLHRITEEPYRMNPPAAGQCLIFPHPDVHGDRFCDVFVSEDALEIIQSGKEIYPPDALIVKAKYPDAERRQIELFTVMRKMNRGYSPNHGDWEFSVVDADLRHVLARGRLESCMECHDYYAVTDFVTRTYLQK